MWVQRGCKRSIIETGVIMSQSFEWDPDKAKKNFGKHEVDFDEASSVFDDPMFITVLDEEHSDDEERYITIGLSNKNRLLLIAHTERNDVIRIISARKATKNEEKFYEEAG
jgi:uncharacterized DUF497 family protein